MEEKITIIFPIKKKTVLIYSHSKREIHHKLKNEELLSNDPNYSHPIQHKLIKIPKCQSHNCSQSQIFQFMHSMKIIPKKTRRTSLA